MRGGTPNKRSFVECGEQSLFLLHMSLTLSLCSFCFLLPFVFAQRERVLSFASTTDNAADDPVDPKRRKTGPSAKAQSRGLAADADGSSSDGAGVCVSSFFFSRPIFL